MEPSSLAIIFASIIGFLLVFEFVYKYRKTRLGKKPLPSRAPFPIIGNAWHFLKDRTSIGLHKAVRTYLPDKPLAAVWIAHKLVLMVNDARYIEGLVAKGVASRKPDELYAIFDEITSGVFVTRDKKRWLDTRRPLDKMMHPKFTPNWYETFVRNAHKLIATLETKKGVFEVQESTFKFTFANVVETHMGVKDASKLTEFEVLHHRVAKLIELVTLRALNIAHRFDSYYRFTANYRTLKSCFDNGVETFLDIFSQRQNDLKEKGITDVDGDDDDYSFSDVIVKLATAGGKPLDKMEAVKIANDFIVAGSHTTSSSLSSVLLHLAMHPEYQERAYQEQKDLFQDSLHPPTYEDLEKMEFMDRVLKESMRHSGVPGVGRLLSDDLEIDDYFIPKHTLLFVNYVTLHRNPKYWEKPDEFYPDHFLPEVVEKRPKGAYVPFSVGARACAGRMYALYSMKIALSMLLRKFKFTTPLKFKEAQLQLTVVQVPLKILIEVTPRT